MTSTLRHLLIQRAARLQDRPALSTPEWGTLNYFQLRNRVEGVALGLMTIPCGSVITSRTGTPWDWVCEVAAACCGLQWEGGGESVDPAILGGPRFNDESGRQPYHDREEAVLESTLFQASRTQGEWLQRLQRLNGKLGWDHASLVEVPAAALGTEDGRGALWCALFAGAHARLGMEPARKGLAGRFSEVEPAIWESGAFRSLFLE